MSLAKLNIFLDLLAYLNNEKNIISSSLFYILKEKTD